MHYSEGMSNNACVNTEANPATGIENREWFNKNQAAQYIGCSLRHLDNLLARRLIPCSRLGRRVIIRRASLNRSLEKLEV